MPSFGKDGYSTELEVSKSHSDGRKGQPAASKALEGTEERIFFILDRNNCNLKSLSQLLPGMEARTC